MVDNENKFIFEDGNFLIAFSTSEDGNLAYKYGGEKQVGQNRTKFLKRIGIDSNHLHIIQPTHSNAISVKDRFTSNTETYRQSLVVEGEYDDFKAGVDGFLTFNQEYVGLLTGDCIPLLLWHHISSLHGVIHIGLLGVINKIVNNLQPIFSKYHIEPSEVNYLIGPAIHQESYDLKNSSLWNGIKEEVLSKTPRFEEFISTQNKCYKLSLHRAVTEQLKSIGAEEEKIQSHPDNTANPDSMFYSHYYARMNDQPEGRFMSVIGSNQ